MFLGRRGFSRGHENPPTQRNHLTIDLCHRSLSCHNILYFKIRESGNKTMAETRLEPLIFRSEVQRANHKPTAPPQRIRVMV